MFTTNTVPELERLTLASRASIERVGTAARKISRKVQTWYLDRIPGTNEPHTYINNKNKFIYMSTVYDYENIYEHWQIPAMT